ncbi:MAG TPA: L-fucose:H+ symporter permease [Polyangia bacterium]|jgi:FHS family L-fucose permease-like MFS transporter|nr:L-fucose:H+ symporter permease [Polyangia bacterium]
MAPLAVLTTLFFMWGFITCLNDIIIPHLKAVFELNYAQAMLIQFAFFTAYFVVSLPSGLIVNRLGYKNGIIIGLVTAGLGCLLFYPAAGARSYVLFLLALFILAAGITLLQVAANPFVAILGKPETASSRLTMTQALNSLGTTIAPIFGSLIILSTVVKSPAEIKQLSPAAAEAYRIAEASSVQTPYLGLAAALILLAVAIALFKLPKIDAASGGSDVGAGAESHSRKSAWSYRHLVLGAVGIFVYVGAEVAIGSFLVNYFKEPSIGGLSEAEGARYVSFYWGGAMIGRFIGTATLRLIRPGKLLAAHAFAAALLVIGTMLFTGQAAMWSVILVGLFNSIMFPTIFTIAIDGLGKHTGQGSGILCMAIVGGALIPVIQGALADRIGIHHCFIIPVICYLYIAWYGIAGHRPIQKAPDVAASQVPV